MDLKNYLVIPDTLQVKTETDGKVVKLRVRLHASSGGSLDVVPLCFGADLQFNFDDLFTAAPGQMFPLVRIKI
jgi:hypothetical protein